MDAPVACRVCERLGRRGADLREELAAESLALAFVPGGRRLQTLADDRTWVGGTVGILAVLHTWSRTLEYHPHAHLLVTAGGLSPDGSAWGQPAHRRFLLPGFALSQIFRAKMRDALARVQQIGRGEHAARYLSRSVYRVALTNDRLDRFEHGRVTFRYTHARTGESRRLTLPEDAFIARFLQHVLPRGFTKIRSSGLLSPSRRGDLEHARHLLELHAANPAPDSSAATAGMSTATTPTTTPSTITLARCCPVCHQGPLRFVASLQRPRAPP